MNGNTEYGEPTRETNISSSRVGIIGCGHLGLSIANQLLSKGFRKDHLLITVSGSPSGLQRVAASSLSDRIASNAEVASVCDLILIALRPSQLDALGGIFFRERCVIVSAMAGLEREMIQKAINHAIIRIMPSSPMSIERSRAICATYPVHKTVSALLDFLEIRTYELSAEADFHLFTAMVCLPAAFLELGFSDTSAIANLYHFQPFQEILEWAKNQTPTGLSTSAREEYIARMATRGGVTEAIVTSIRAGNDINAALADGMRRSECISSNAS